MNASESNPKQINRLDYQPPNYWVESIELTFDLFETHTEVSSEVRFFKNNAVDNPNKQWLLDGVDLELKSVKLEGVSLLDSAHEPSSMFKKVKLKQHAEAIELSGLPNQGCLTIVTHIKPQENTALEGLYVSNGMYCTQCEAEGFRKITYFPDRPDVMSSYQVKIIADQAKYPVLLSNGNRIAEGVLDNGRHWVQWADPFKKPAYLFALVAGNLACVQDHYITMSGREVVLQIYVEPQDANKVDFAMQSLKAAMRWDEQTYGREYDLDIYMIVAVSHFNMGAMENKGLNIFNTSCVLAHPATTTDAGFERVEAVIAHEYFHNWSGNRVTCRDWFQLSLKEGFTVFRDQCFSADTRSEAVKRVADVSYLRAHQFAEDAGPMAHPIRPDSYIEINNFYTLTVYEKGAEVVRMLHHLLGAQGFRAGSDAYFERFDGQAVTCDDFVAVMFETNPGVLSEAEQTAFQRWYQQPGTPEVQIITDYDANQCTLQLTLTQKITENPNVTLQAPLLIPIKIGLLDPKGQPLSFSVQSDSSSKGSKAGQEGRVSETVLPFKAMTQKFTVNNVMQAPVVSYLRGFSAPVKLQLSRTLAEWAFLMQHDADPFARWEAANQLYVQALNETIERFSVMSIAALPAAVPEFPDTLALAYRSILETEFADLAEKAQMLALPSEVYLSGLKSPIEVESIFWARKHLMRQLAQDNVDLWRQLYQDCSQKLAGMDYEPSPIQIAQRALKNTALSYLMLSDSEEAVGLCKEQYHQANNMTDQRAALNLLARSQAPERLELLEDFYQQWQAEPLVVDQWLMIQATNPEGNTLVEVKRLMQHPAFDIKNPNKVRALIGAFAGSNLVHFHRTDGEGYAFLTECILELNAINPAIAARLVTPLTRWRKHLPHRQALMQEALQSIMACQTLAPDVYEVVSKSLLQR